ncbi:PREDICTED: tumor necrosis factor ligand superfamily member 18 isoform X2 [Miniopterus natalensis]|uniref:tumor necrosis factor ligand superfamily member 18 isoform X2 n=1 Tax=Miniopterus natalensis TaxID=291302 RepID=UPI0007A71366|nr:PREDICTED: tumor necrosis factor ligand superfamily member 18 isoform X2 [Miniopterus natalensis]
MSLRHMENMPFHHASPPGAQRQCWKPWIFSALVLVLLVCSFSTVAFTLFPLKAVSEPCVAKFGPSPSKWQMSSPELPCVSQIADWELKILRDGLYSIYGQVAPNTTYEEKAPFEVRLRKNKDVIQALTNNAIIQNVGGTYELHAGDIIDLIFNAKHQVLKNNTYWGILLLANPQFIS